MLQAARTVRTGLLAALALVGWVALVAFSVEPSPVFAPPVVRWDAAAAMLLGALARLLAFRVFERARIALDSAFYVAATFVFGPVSAAWMVLVTLSVDAVARYFDGSGVLRRGEASRAYTLAHLAHLGALPALVTLVLGGLFRVRSLDTYDDATLAWLVPVYSLSFLCVHYFVAGGAHWMHGATSRSLFRGYFAKVVLAELTLVPLSLAMVLNYRHFGPGMYILLGGTALLFNWIFRRATITASKLDERARELETINRVSRALSGTLDRKTLLTNISLETVRLVGHASRFVIGVYDQSHENVLFDFFDDRGANTGQATIPRGAGLTGWIMEHRQPLLLGDARRDYRRFAATEKYRDPAFQSWLGVPLVIYEEVMGVLAVESEQPKAYTREHLRVLTTIADTAAVALENARLYELATVDGLTGLFVRRHFDQRLIEEWRRSQRYGSGFTLGLFDLDNFKQLNDTHGHQAGDHALRSAAAVVRGNMRGADLAGRYGGEEFAFILPRTSAAEAMVVAERIRRDIDALALTLGAKPLRVTTSIGLASYPEASTHDVGTLIARADQALYEAKRRGKNCVVSWESLGSGGPSHGEAPVSLH